MTALDTREVDSLDTIVRLSTYPSCAFAATHVPSVPGTPKSELLRGTLEMLVLQTVSLQPLHGYAIAQQIQRLSNDALTVEQGSLYPALERLLQRGWVTAKWGESPTGRRARYYTITASGRRRLGEEIEGFDSALLAINRVLRRV